MCLNSHLDQSKVANEIVWTVEENECNNQWTCIHILIVNAFLINVRACQCLKYSYNCNNHWLISWALPLIEWFYPLGPGHSQGRGSVVLIRYYGPVVSDQHFSSLFIHAFSAACPSLPSALFLSPALIPSLPSILHNDWAGNPLHSISTGNSQVHQPRLLHCSCSSVYLAIFRSYASSHLVSQGTVSSTITSFLSFEDHIRTMSGLCAMWRMFEKLAVSLGLLSSPSNQIRQWLM